jgi:hypothetical protein
VDLQYLVEQGITCMRNHEGQREIYDTKMSAKKHMYTYCSNKQASYGSKQLNKQELQGIRLTVNVAGTIQKQATSIHTQVLLNQRG